MSVECSIRPKNHQIRGIIFRKNRVPNFFFSWAHIRVELMSCLLAEKSATVLQGGVSRKSPGLHRPFAP